MSSRAVVPPRWWATRGVGDTLCLGLGVLIVCLLCTRDLWHGLDAYDFVGRFENGVLVNPRHPLYLPLAALIVRPLVALGVPVFDAAVAASSVGTALGCALAHRAGLAAGLPRREALLATAAAAACFAVLYYGTVVEIHGVFLIAAGAAWWIAVRCARRPGVAAGALLGVVTGVGASIHATGHVLLPAFALFAAAQLGWRGLLRAWPAALALLLLHAAVVAGLHLWLLPESVRHAPEPEAGAVSYLQHLRSFGTDWSCLPRTLWREWLAPFLPVSILALLAFLSRGQRRFGLAMVGAVVGYTVFTNMLLAPAGIVARPQYLPPFATMEYGAYLLPLVFPAAVLGLRLLPPRLRPWLPVLALCWSLPHLFWSSRVPGDLAYARDALAVMDRLDARLYCGGYDEFDGIKQLRPQADVHPVYEMHIVLASQPDIPFDHVTAWWHVQHAEVRRRGGEMLITDDALSLMRATRDGLLDRLVDEYLPAHFRLEPVEKGRFRAFVVRALP
ncbi:MAG: hypothetical protein AB7O97_17025 [Planctomycetota bacterium]